MQRSIFDIAEQKKQHGINLAYANADTIWKVEAANALRLMAQSNITFTTDEIWEHLASKGIHTGENRAIGAIMQAARRSGMIEATGQYRQTNRTRAHKRPVAIWLSRIYQKDKEYGDTH
jgi:hypothetical protein